MSTRRITKVLVANRGEIAVRVIRSARALGYGTVAVFSDPDADAPHVLAADEAVRIGPGEAGLSYLSIDRVLEAARRTGADALHPGYGFLAENGDLARRCAEADITFVGPPEHAIRLMGDKVQAKLRMLEAGVPTAPGYHGSDQSEARLQAEARALGVPLLVKAVAGGGGRGMRVVRDLAELSASIERARSEARNAFGNGDLFLERLVEGARHVEIQVFADRHGNVIHLGERECSVQRRHQKVIEEAPSVAVDAELRARMGEAAVAAARAIDYVGAGTVEFLLDDAGAFYFLEMNTRLQVEHPVTEIVTGVDLVAWQLEIAAGERLPLGQADVALRGHAIEARLYAEDPWAGFLPQLGEVFAWVEAEGEGVRVDAGIRAGQMISAFYDPMVAKIIGFGPSREVARRRLVQALRRCVLLGPITNRRFLIDLLDGEAFRTGEIKTDTLDAMPPPPRPEPSPDAWVLAAVLRSREATGARVSTDADPWRPTSGGDWPVVLVHADERRELRVAPRGRDRFEVRTGDGDGESRFDVVLLACEPSAVRVEIDGVRRRFTVASTGSLVVLDQDGHVFAFEEPAVLRAAGEGAGGDGRVVAPMGGRVLAVRVAVGDVVEPGQALLVVEAMKMEHRVTASVAGRVTAISVGEGDQVAARQVLATIEPAEASGRGEQT
jgi:geranyl-CoA carboxylase alpha subunit